MEKQSNSYIESAKIPLMPKLDKA